MFYSIIINNINYKQFKHPLQVICMLKLFSIFIPMLFLKHINWNPLTTNMIYQSVKEGKRKKVSTHNTQAQVLSQPWALIPRCHDPNFGPMTPGQRFDSKGSSYSTLVVNQFHAGSQPKHSEFFLSFFFHTYVPLEFSPTNNIQNITHKQQD